MTILSATGTPLPPAATETKLAYDPAVLASEKKRFNTILQEMTGDFVRDLSPEPNNPTLVKADLQTAREHYGNKFREIARVNNQAGRPHTVDENAMFNIIDQLIAEQKQRQDLAKPLHHVIDLQPYGLLPVGQTAAGTLHINSHVAVCVAPEGLVRVWLRATDEPLDWWATAWLPKPQRSPVLETVGLTLNDLYTVLGGLRMQPAPLTEHLMMAARTLEVPAKKTWWKR
jgi:hypothetical protein